MFLFFSAFDIADVSTFARSRTLGDETALFMVLSAPPFIDVLLLAEDGDSISPVDVFAVCCTGKVGGIPGMGLRP